MQLKKTALAIGIGFSIALSSGCSTMNGPEYGGDKELAYKKNQIKELVDNFESHPSYTRIPITGVKVEVAATTDDRLLNLKVKNLTADGIDLFSVLSLSTGNLNIVVSEELKSLPVFINNFTGTLKSLLDTIQKTMGVFYAVEDGSLYLTKTQKFFVRFPPNFDETLTKTISDNLTQMGAKNVYFNPLYSSASYVADYETSQVINHFLEDVEKSLVTIVYDTWIWEVDITGSESNGINFNSINLGSNVVLSGGFQGAVAGGVATAIKTDSSQGVNFDGIVSLLKTSGKLSTLSHPTLSMMSGSSAKFELSTQHLYISKVTTTGDTTGTTGSISAGSVGVETAELKTGLTLDVGGRYYGDSVFSKINMELSDALPNESVDVAGVKVSLPNTFSRKYESDARIKVGNYYLVAGINYKKSSKTMEGIPSGVIPGFLQDKIIPTGMSSSESTVELVMLMRPRIVEFYKTVEKEAHKKNETQNNLLKQILQEYKPSSKERKEVVESKPIKKVYQKTEKTEKAAVKVIPATIPANSNYSELLEGVINDSFVPTYDSSSENITLKSSFSKTGFPIRKAPSPRAKIIGLSKTGKKVLIVEKNASWYRLSTGGWVHSSIVNP